MSCKAAPGLRSAARAKAYRDAALRKLRRAGVTFAPPGTAPITLSSRGACVPVDISIDNADADFADCLAAYSEDFEAGLAAVVPVKTPPDEFSRRRFDRLLEQDNAAASPEDALALAQRHLEEHGSSGNAMVIIEERDGGTALFSSQVTAAVAVFLLESVKLSVLSDFD